MAENQTERDSLIEIFMAVADAVDGGEDVPEDIREAYTAAMKNPHIERLYGDLCDEASELWLGPKE